MNIKFKWYHFLKFFMHPLLGTSIFALIKNCTSVKSMPSVLFIPKFSFVVLMSILNLPFMLLEYVVSLFRKKKEIVAPVFIIGHPRSGTTFLHNLISQDQQFYSPKLYEVLFPNYPTTFGRVLKKLIAPIMPGKRPQDNVEIGLDAPQEEEFAMASFAGISFINGFYFPKNFKQNFKSSVLFDSERVKRSWQKEFKKFAVKVKAKNHNQTIVFKSPANIGRIEAILEMYPDAKFIHIYRSPEDTMRSTLNLFEEVIPQTSFQIVKSSTMIDNALYMYNQLFEAFFEQKKAIPEGQFYELSFEELKKRPYHAIASCYKELNIDLRDDYKEALTVAQENAKSYQMNTHKKLDEKIADQLKREGAKVYKNYNYS